MKMLQYALLITVMFIPAWAIAEGTHNHDHNHHGVQETSGYGANPTIKLEVFKDTASGWNLHLICENFTFTPENINKMIDKPEGHAHVYVDGKKVSRIYGPWFHLTGLTPGAHTVRVSLNANDHKEFVINGKPIDDTVEVIVD